MHRIHGGADDANGLLIAALMAAKRLSIAYTACTACTAYTEELMTRMGC